MCAALVGGMDRLRREYMNEADRQDVTLKHFTGKERVIAKSIGKVDVVVLFTNKVSHKARKDVIKACKKDNIPVIQHHSCGLGSLRKCLDQALSGIR